MKYIVHLFYFLIKKLFFCSSRAVALSPAHNVHDLMKKSLLNKNFKVFIVAAEYDSPAFIEQSFNYAEVSRGSCK